MRQIADWLGEIGPFVDAARYLTERTGQSGQVSFETASALELPFDDGRFDVVLLQHVAMNISDRARLIARSDAC